MKRFIIAIVTTGLLISPAVAQSSKGKALVTVPANGPSKFQWVLIEDCAADPKDEWNLYCRSWIDAREVGRLDALRDQGKK